jgi:ketosteroid isomerase-like protein
MAVADDVRNASDQFYGALNRMVNGDASSMAEIWSQSATVTTMHPIGGREVGWQEVRGAWEQVAALGTGGTVSLNDQLLETAGDMAYEVGIERGQMTLAGRNVPIEHRVTNVYRREADGWKIVHHHTDLAPEMVELLKSL